MDDSIESQCRFGGLLSLLNVVQFKKNKILNSDIPLPIKTGLQSNKPDYKKYAELLIKKCKEFIIS